MNLCGATLLRPLSHVSPLLLLLLLQVFLVREKIDGEIYAMKVLEKDNIIKRKQVSGCYGAPYWRKDDTSAMCLLSGSETQQLPCFRFDFAKK